ncbi:hypothetical protein DAEQUDRAFT_608799 [Daedalea quercina L-15889]|uniref:Uncharacterized protein n=1 Tax=Daedalea quercina L-15889 TaxID=1314783 RepID=A0A165LIH5_9APHY|nr:hypothetical protein DAEQUDRAFT_608799 [Daedalea quercina L-15889]
MVRRLSKSSPAHGYLFAWTAPLSRTAQQNRRSRSIYQHPYVGLLTAGITACMTSYDGFPRQPTSNVHIEHSVSVLQPTNGICYHLHNGPRSIYPCAQHSTMKRRLHGLAPISLHR